MLFTQLGSVILLSVSLSSNCHPLIEDSEDLPLDPSAMDRGHVSCNFGVAAESQLTEVREHRLPFPYSDRSSEHGPL